MSFTVGGGVQVETLVLFVFLSRGIAALGSEGSNANATVRSVVKNKVVS